MSLEVSAVVMPSTHHVVDDHERLAGGFGMIVRPTAVLTEANVIEILERLKQKIPHRLIAIEFGVSKKTISRINTGETWRKVSLRYGTHPPIQMVMPLAELLTEFCDLHDEITAVKNHFAFSFQQPIYWGWFESWDGLHALASDGYIIWESTDLVKYAQKLAATGLTGSPVWAEKAEELSTFELGTFMNRSIGDRFNIYTSDSDAVRCFTESGSVVLLRRKYVNVAAKMKLEIREAGSGSDAVYLTRNKPKSKRDPTSIVIAAVSTMIEEA
jgi:hypothetical protein